MGFVPASDKSVLLTAESSELQLLVVGISVMLSKQKEIGACIRIVNHTALPMRFHTRKWIKPEDLNANKTLFGGRLLAWIDEEAALYSIIQLENHHVVTRHMSSIDFLSSARENDIIEIGIEPVHFGTTSITLRCEVRNKMTRNSIIKIDKIVMVNLDEKGHPKPHGKTQIEYVKDRLEGAE